MDKLPVFFRQEQSSKAAASYSPSAGKPALVMADWLGNDKLAPLLEVHSFEPANDAVLCGAHDPGYVAGVLSGEIENGFENTNMEIANSLRYTVGSMLAAATYVLTDKNRGPVRMACSPTSGFHHAGYAWGGGYCTFNGLIATAVRVHQLGLAKRILILDFDQHYGNGTQDIIDFLKLDFITHITAIKSYNTTAQTLAKADLLNNNTLCNDHHNQKFDLILYQAGADIHLDDPLRGRLTTSQMCQRDANIFTAAQVWGIPLVWNLAGGYQRDKAGTIAPVLALHHQTLMECLSLKTCNAPASSS